MINILYVSHLHAPRTPDMSNIGGMQRVSTDLLEELKRHRRVRVFSILQQTSWRGIGWKTVVFWFRILLMIPIVVRNKRIDVVLFSSMVTASVATAIRPFVGVPMATIVHGKDVTWPWWPFQQILPTLFKNLDAVIGVSRATRQACLERGLKAELAWTISNGVHVPSNVRSAMSRSRDNLERRFHRSFGTRPLLLSVGRLVPRKGHAWFIRNVLPALRPDIQYLIIGDGPEKETILKAIRILGLESRVTVAGTQPDAALQEAYSAADVFVMPNIPVKGDMEGFGLVMLEANAHGLPVVASELEGITDVIRHGVNGLCVPHSSEMAFGKAVETILAGGYAKEEVRNYVVRNFSWPAIGASYVHGLFNLTQHCRPPKSVDDVLVTVETQPSI